VPGFQPQNDSSAKSSGRRKLVFQQNRPPAACQCLADRVSTYTCEGTDDESLNVTFRLLQCEPVRPIGRRLAPQLAPSARIMSETSVKFNAYSHTRVCGNAGAPRAPSLGASGLRLQPSDTPICFCAVRPPVRRVRRLSTLSGPSRATANRH